MKCLIVSKKDIAITQQWKGVYWSPINIKKNIILRIQQFMLPLLQAVMLLLSSSDSIFTMVMIRAVTD